MMNEIRNIVMDEIQNILDPKGVSLDVHDEYILRLYIDVDANCYLIFLDDRVHIKKYRSYDDDNERTIYYHHADLFNTILKNIEDVMDFELTDVVIP